jgi:hypothetical protein
MSKAIARYSVTSGLAGCYMPNSSGGPYAFTTRRDLANFIRDEIEFLDWPASMIRQVPLQRIWSHIKHHGSSVAHFSIERKGYELAFHGLTEAEFAEMEEQADI